MKLKWILICLLVAVGITGCKEEPTPKPVDYYDGIGGANSLGDTTSISNFQSTEGIIRLLTFLEGGTALGFIINGIVNNNLSLYQNALQVKKLSEELKNSLAVLDKDLSKMYNKLKDDLITLELSVQNVDSVRVISLRQNRLAYYRKCNDDLVNEQQIVFSRSVAYFNTINELLKDTIGKAHEDTVNFYRRLDPVVSEWAGEGGIYIDEVKNLMDKMVTTYSVSYLGQSTYDVGMPATYRNLVQWTFPEQKDKDKRIQLYKTLLTRDLKNMYFAYYLTDIYCQTKMSLYQSESAKTSYNEFKALKENVMKCYFSKQELQ